MKSKKTVPLKTLRVVLLSDGKVICVQASSKELKSLTNGREIIKDFFYDLPNLLQSFFIEHPEQIELFPQGFAWWVICKLKGKEDPNENLYGMLKRKMSEFHEKLLTVVKNLVKTAVIQIKKFKRKSQEAPRKKKQVVTFDPAKKAKFFYYKRKHCWNKREN